MNIIEQIERLGYKREQVRKIPEDIKEFDHVEYKTFPLVDTDKWSKENIKISIWQDSGMTNVISYNGETFSKFLPIPLLMPFLTSKVLPLPYGVGLFAITDLPKGIIVETFRGEIKQYDQIPTELKRYALDMSVNDNEDKWMLVTSDAGLANHSCNPNCKIDADKNIVTIKEVKQGEELTYSYNRIGKGFEKYEWKQEWSFECKCGSNNCQKVINKYIY